MNLSKYLYILMMAAVLGTAATSCGPEEDDSDIVLGGGTGNTRPGGSNGDDEDGPNSGERGDQPLTGTAARIEVPVLREGSIFIEHSTTERGVQVLNYCLEYDTHANHSRWVAFRFDGTTRNTNVGRSGDFAEDPKLPSQYYHGSGGFGSGYDRGHICASADRLYSLDANIQTFYMTNMSPQMSRFNQDYWVGYEGKVQNWGRSKSFSDTLYVVKGGTIDEGQTLGTLSRNGKKVAIPRYYFMALLKCKNNTYSALAFFMEHKNYGIVFDNLSASAKKQEFLDHIITIDELEEKTGIDFFHNLPDQIENAVEQTVTLSAWDL